MLSQEQTEQFRFMKATKTYIVCAGGPRLLLMYLAGDPLKTQQAGSSLALRLRKSTVSEEFLDPLVRAMFATHA